ncbi:MAG: helix-turn-helix transcriptional regulator [Saprospiraceae bacterium]|nr:helix-turn-helix transcriptional regulator [Saprospiraceae bacterium]MBK9721809.1 helix-turn-helix transcriptional regulator [Saprospiraceae bacterium]
MVSNRCKIAVKEVLNKLKLHFIVIDLGEVEIMEDLSIQQWDTLKELLHGFGFELMDDKKGLLIQRIKIAIAEILNLEGEFNKAEFSTILSQKLNLDYNYLASLFSEMQGITILQYLSIQKIELIKELIIYGELSITQIAWKLNYSSVAHLSNQFKKITGLSPSHFKLVKEERNRATQEIILNDI